MYPRDSSRTHHCTNKIANWALWPKFAKAARDWVPTLWHFTAISNYRQSRATTSLNQRKLATLMVSDWENWRESHRKFHLYRMNLSWTFLNLSWGWEIPFLGPMSCKMMWHSHLQNCKGGIAKQMLCTHRVISPEKHQDWCMSLNLK